LLASQLPVATPFKSAIDEGLGFAGCVARKTPSVHIITSRPSASFRSRRRAGRQFHGYRFRAFVRQWKKGGDAFVHATVSRVLDDALTRRSGRIETHILSRA
jgi:hypothetical protein